MSKYDQCVLTGCDAKTEWQLDWFMENYLKDNTGIPIVLCDFGMNPQTLERIKLLFSGIMDLKDSNQKGWFKKPIALFNSPGKKTLWLDTDCEVKSNLQPLFNEIIPNKLSMVEDKPWSTRRGEIWHNSGVVGITGRPQILHSWCNAVTQSPEVGDQEVLHSLLNPITRMTHINDLPFEWNVVRLATDHDGYKGPIKIQHHTGQKGNDKIKGLMKIKEVING